MAAGLGSAAGSLAQGDDFKTALAGGLLSYGMGSMLSAAPGLEGVGAGVETATAAPLMGPTNAAAEAVTQNVTQNAALAGGQPLTPFDMTMGLNGANPGIPNIPPSMLDPVVRDSITSFGNAVDDPLY